MALVACSECGHQISSLARFCPKCNNQKKTVGQNPPRQNAPTVSENDIPDTVAPLNSTFFSSKTANNEELLQLEFKPSMDEMVIMEGSTFLIKGFLNVSDCYAYLTTKRYALCDASGENIIFQISNNVFAAVTEGRHLISKKIIITTVTGETYQVKCLRHDRWLRALQDPQEAAHASGKPGAQLTESADYIEWYYEENEIRIGPVLQKHMIQLIQNNHTIYRNTSVWNAYLTEWKRAEETILSFYFNDSDASGVDFPGSMKASRMSGRSSYSRIRLMFKRYL